MSVNKSSRKKRAALSLIGIGCALTTIRLNSEFAATPLFQREPHTFLQKHLNRSRTDALRGRFSGVKRSLIARELRRGTETNLRHVKQMLE